MLADRSRPVRIWEIVMVWRRGDETLFMQVKALEMQHPGPESTHVNDPK